MKDESTIQQEVQMKAMYYNCLLMRNNSGAFKDETGRLVRYGLGNVSEQNSKNLKSSDLIGITTIIITPDMVGKKIGVFTAIECKKEEWKLNKTFNDRETAQQNFIKLVESKGGIAFFANSIDSLENLKIK